MKVPPKRKGNIRTHARAYMPTYPSMKVPPKRKGNPDEPPGHTMRSPALNESPSEKEGKYAPLPVTVENVLAPQ